MKEVKIAACQPYFNDRGLDYSLNVIYRYSLEAEVQGAQLICFPECFLQGYQVNQKTCELAINLNSDIFSVVLEKLKDLKSIIVFGFIENYQDKIYNSAVVVFEGQVVGCYRKVNLHGGERDVFESGVQVPIFEIANLKFGINICADLNFSKTVNLVSKQGARLLISPCNNMMKLDTAEKWKTKHNQIRVERCIESDILLISADVTGCKAGQVSYGPTAVIDPSGAVVNQLPLLKPGLLVQSVYL